MTTQDIAAAVHRAEAVLRRRPETGLHDDTIATATWQSGTRMIASHDNGTQLATDMPSEIGGSGDRITPGWLFRAGLASCSATSIVLAAAAAGVELTALEVKARSRSDLRGLLGVADVDGGAVPAGPRDVQLHVRVAAAGVSAERLRALVEEGCRRSPVPNVVECASPIDLQIDIAD